MRAEYDIEHRRPGLAAVARRPGLRIPGALDGFDAVFRIVLGTRWGRTVAGAIGTPTECGIPGLDRLMPGPDQVAAAGPAGLESLGVPRRRAEVLAAVAGALADRGLRLEPGGDVATAQRSLLAIDGLGERLATTIVMHALHWPDAFPGHDRALQRAAGAATPTQLRTRADAWRPWRAYAATHLRLV